MGEHDDESPVTAALEGWGSPEPRADFAQRVVDATEPIRRPRSRLGWSAALLAGGVAAGLGLARVRDTAVPPASTPSVRVEADAWGRFPLADGAAAILERGAVLTLTVEGSQQVATVERGRVVLVGGPNGLTLRTHNGDEHVESGACVRVDLERGLLGAEESVDEVPCPE